MPKSRREKVVHLSKTGKKGKKAKEQLIEKLREHVEEFSNIFVFSVENQRNNKLKEVRNDWKSSRIYLGKNKVMIIALGRSPSEEHKTNLHKLTQHIHGNRGLLFTNSNKESVFKYFGSINDPQYARSGAVATKTFELPAGVLTTMPFSMEVRLRQLGLPTALKDGLVVLAAKTTICQKGDILTPEQCKLLQLFEEKMATFRFDIHGVWNKKTEDVEEFEVEEDESVVEDDNMDDDDDDSDGPVEISLPGMFE